MKVYLTSQFPLDDTRKIKYEFEGEVVTIHMDEITEVFDFTNIPNGKLKLYNKDGSLNIQTNFDPFPILNAEKENGILYLTLLNYISFPTTPEEDHPEWIDAKDYEFKY